MMRSAAARGEVAVLDRARKGSRAFIARCCSIFSRICVGSKIWEVEVVDLMKFTMPFQPSGCCPYEHRRWNYHEAARQQVRSYQMKHEVTIEDQWTHYKWSRRFSRCRMLLNVDSSRMYDYSSSRTCHKYQTGPCQDSRSTKQLPLRRLAKSAIRTSEETLCSRDQPCWSFSN